MSSVVDERIVQMSFDNDKFEKGVSQTLTSLDKLNTNLEKVSDGKYFEKLESGVEKIEQAFSESGMVINGILLNIGRTIEGYLLSAINSLTTGIRNGLAEYNTQMDATQTILGNVKDEGKGIDDVTKALDNLNHYADLTIYNFTEMTRNIGMFTAAGSDLETSVATIKGLANAAAMAGASSAQASRAWYQVSQAMAAGTFRLMDWRSLENASIAGEAFQNVLKEVARKDGIAIDDMIKKHGALRYTLEEGWLTAERFSEAMFILSGEMTDAMMKSKGYTEEQIKFLREIASTAQEAATKVKTFAQLVQTTSEAIGSGWARTFRIIVGDFEKAKKFFTRISNVLNDFIGRVSDFRNDLIESIMNTGGIGSVYNSIKKTIDNILAIFTTFVNAARAGFMTIFPEERIVGFFKTLFGNVERLTRSFVLNSTNLVKTDLMDSSVWDLENINYAVRNLIRIFRDLFAAIDSIWIIIRDIATFVWDLIPGTENLFDTLEDGNKGLIERLADILDNVAKFHDVMLVDYQLIPKFLTFIQNQLVKLGQTKFVKNLKTSFDNIITSFGLLIGNLKKLNITPILILTKAIEVLGVASVIAMTAIATTIKFIGGAFEWLAGLFGFNTVSDKLEKPIKENSNNLEKFDKKAKKIKGSLRDVETEQKNFERTVEKSPIVSFAESIGAGLLAVIDTVVNRIAEGIDYVVNLPPIKAIIDMIVLIWAAIEKIVTVVDTFLDNVNKALKGSIDSLFKVLVSLGFILSAIGAVIALNIIKSLLSFANLLNAIANDINAKAFLELAKGVALIAASLFALSFVDPNNLKEVAIVLGILVASLYGFMTILSFLKDLLKGKILQKAIDTVTNGLLTAISGFFKKAGVSLIINSISKSILRLAESFAILAIVFHYFPNEGKDALDAILAMVGVLSAVTIVLALLTRTTKSFLETIKTLKDAKVLTTLVAGFVEFFKLIGVAAIITSIALSVTLLSVALRMLSQLSWEQIWPALLSIVSLLTVLGLIAGFMMSLYKAGSADLFLKLGALFFGLGVGMAALISAASLIKSDEQMNALMWGLAFSFIDMMAAMVFIIQAADTVDSVKLQMAAGTLVMTAYALSVFGIAMAAASALMQHVELTATYYLATIGFLVIFGVFVEVLVELSSKLTFNIPALGGVVALIVSICGGVLSVALALKMLSGITIDYGILALFGIISAVITGEILGLVAIMSIFPISTIPANLATATALILSVISTVLFTAISLRLLSNVSIDSGVLTVFGIISAFITGALTAIMYFIVGLSGMAISPLVILSLSTVILSVVGLVIAMGQMMSSLSGVYIDSNITTTLIVIVSCLTGIVLILSALASIPEMAIPSIVLLSAAALVIAIGAAILAIGKALEALSYIDIDPGILTTFNTIAGIMGAVVFAFVTISILISAFAPEATAAAAALTAAEGALFAGLAALGAAIGLAFYLLSEAFLNFGTIINELTSDPFGWVAKIYETALIIASIIPALGLIFISVGVGVGLAIAGIAVGIISVATVVASAITAAMLVVLVKVSEFIEGHPTEVKQAIHAVAEAFKIIVIAIFDELVLQLQDAEWERFWTAIGTVFINLIAMAAVIAYTPILAVIAILVAAIVAAFVWALVPGLAIGMSAIGAIVATIGATWDVLTGDAEDFGDAFLTHWNGFWDNVVDVAGDALRALGFEIEGFNDVVNEGWTEMLSNLKELKKELEPVGDKLKEASESYNAWKDSKYGHYGVSQDTDNQNRQGTHSEGHSNLSSVNTVVGAMDRYKQSIDAATDSSDHLNRSLNDTKNTATGFGSRTFLNSFSSFNFALDENRLTAIRAANDISNASIWTSEVIDRTSESNRERKGIERASFEKENDAIVESESKKASDVESIHNDMWDDLLDKALNGELSLEDIGEYGAGALSRLAEEFGVDLNNITFEGLSDMLGIEIDGIDDLLNIENSGLLEALGLEGLFWADSNSMTQQELARKAELFKNYWEAGQELQEKAQRKYKEAEYATMYGGAEGKAKAERLTAEADKLMADAAKARAKANAEGISLREYNSLLKGDDSLASWFEGALGDADSFYKDALNEWNNADWDNSLNIGGYNYKSEYSGLGDYEGANKELEKSLQDRNNIINDYSIDPMDATPVINLDQLSSELNQANGMITGSLLAAQNAAIGDYINTDSELNPFLKDRWQTTYNFTQNNYSPKALSRIDIYRQTQNQLRLSRGF